MAFRFFQTISFMYLLFIQNGTVSVLTHDEECSALFEFKQTIFHQPSASFDDGGFNKLASWSKMARNASYDAHSNCCLWDGVLCGNKGHVIGLDLSQSSLRGPINSNTTLFNLVHLQMLNLSMNNFIESQIPFEIARLSQLRSLDLSSSGFSGEIPRGISHLTQLSLLDLSWNPLKLQSFSLEYLLQNLTRLEALHLSGVDISSPVPLFLANFSSLRSIRLGDCQLQDEFPSAIFHLPKLKVLSLRNNTKLVGSLPEFRNGTLLEHLNLFTTGFHGTIPESISKLNHLVFLSLSSCYFSGRIPGSLSNLTQLTYLSLGQNELTGRVPSLGSLSELDILELSYNQFEKGRLLDWLSKLTKLNRLYAHYANIYDELPSSIANLTKLSVVAMRGNFIFGQIPSLFTNLTTLEVVDLSHNQLQGPISSAFSNLKSLKKLDLIMNNFSGRVYLDAFVGLNNLVTLDLGYNRISCVVSNNYTNGSLPELDFLGLSSCDLKEFPPFLRVQKKMTVLNLRENKIEGLVPKWIWNNSQETLRIINLSFNFITGFDEHPPFLPWLHLDVFQFQDNQIHGWLPIPPQNTLFYDVSNNNLTGEIPTSICELKSLQYLDLSSNHMIGILPLCLGNLSNSLLVLDLKRNNFHGQMINTFTHGNPLKMIDLSENQFTSEVPKSLTNCTDLEVLSLGDNSFGGLFPFWLGNHAELQVLILRSNKLSGEIQVLSTNSSQFPKLRILDISNNNFSGRLPDKYFQNWNAMKSYYVSKSSAMEFEFSPDSALMPIMYPYSMTLTHKGVTTEYEVILNIFVAIDMSCNKFVGEISQSLQDLQGLQSLNISNNHLTGHILPSLGNLKNLESLDLSQNELSGEIPQQLLQLGFLAIWNVSFNNLNGRIPQGKQFDTFDNNSYIGNHGLCGQPLSKDCQSSKAETPPPTRNKYESLLPKERIDWIVIFLGVGSGLAIGIIVGNILYARCNDWFIEQLGLRKDTWVTPLSNTRRNQILL